MTVLTMVGFRKQALEGGEYFVIESEAAVVGSCVTAICAALAPAPAPVAAPPAVRLGVDGAPLASAASIPVREEKLSLKQQARRDAEEREKNARLHAKRQREETKKQIAMDNHARRPASLEKTGASRRDRVRVATGPLQDRAVIGTTRAGAQARRELENHRGRHQGWQGHQHVPGKIRRRARRMR